MSDEPETLTSLLRARVSGRSGVTFREFVEAAYDEREGYRVSLRIVSVLRDGGSVQVNPKLVRALAAGLGLPLERVRQAAYRQFIVGEE